MRKSLTKIHGLIKNFKGPVKLNVGCGTDYKNGWINIDNNSDHNIEKLDLDWDLRNPLPFDDNSVDFIFNEHFLEHLTVEEGQGAIKDFMRVLKPDGVLRIAMPDLETAIKFYNDPNWKRRPFIKNFDLQFVQTRAELLNMNFRWWGHKWLYDWEELERRLRDSGCTKIKRKRLGKSQNKELRGLEIRSESLLIAEVEK
jgi:predicted SAM-dependent methyltransferase